MIDTRQLYQQLQHQQMPQEIQAPGPFIDPTTFNSAKEAVPENGAAQLADFDLAEDMHLNFDLGAMDIDCWLEMDGYSGGVGDFSS